MFLENYQKVDLAGELSKVDKAKDRKGILLLHELTKIASTSISCPEKVDRSDSIRFIKYEVE